MSDFWVGTIVGFVSGIVTGLVASYAWELRGRFIIHKSASKLVGTWIAYNVHSRDVDSTPMQHAGPTVISLERHWWSSAAGALDVRAEDSDPTTGKRRDHDGSIVFDAVLPLRATRTVRYADSNEVAEQVLQIAPDFNLIMVFPVADLSTLGNAYRVHALRRKWEI